MTPFPVFFSASFLFFLFFREKKRKNQRKETLSEREMSASQRTDRSRYTFPVFSLRGFSERKAPQNIFCGERAFR